MKQTTFMDACPCSRLTGVILMVTKHPRAKTKFQISEFGVHAASAGNAQLSAKISTAIITIPPCYNNKAALSIWPDLLSSVGLSGFPVSNLALSGCSCFSAHAFVLDLVKIAGRVWILVAQRRPVQSMSKICGALIEVQKKEKRETHTSNSTREYCRTCEANFLKLYSCRPGYHCAIGGDVFLSCALHFLRDIHLVILTGAEEYQNGGPSLSSTLTIHSERGEPEVIHIEKVLSIKRGSLAPQPTASQGIKQVNVFLALDCYQAIRDSGYRIWVMHEHL
ncbi:hypothetical protein Pelo_15877 [Pelomyxa schiedti]|nr:hypothetical protein Pelo_15877 [Pelomyxa schiedti]